MPHVRNTDLYLPDGEGLLPRSSPYPLGRFLMIEALLLLKTALAAAAGGVPSLVVMGLLALALLAFALS